MKSNFGLLGLVDATDGMGVVVDVIAVVVKNWCLLVSQKSNVIHIVEANLEKQ